MEYSLAKKPEYLVAAYRHEHFSYFFDKGALAAETLLNIWKSNDGGPLPVDPAPKKYGFDVAAGGFTNVYSRAHTVPFDLASDFTLPLEPALTREPCRSGHSQSTWMGTQWPPTLCKYAPIPDPSPPGSAAYAADQWAPPAASPPAGPSPAPSAYQTWFHPYDSKTISCLNPKIASHGENGVALDKKGKPLKNPNSMKYLPTTPATSICRSSDPTAQLTGPSPGTAVCLSKAKNGTTFRTPDHASRGWLTTSRWRWAAHRTMRCSCTWLVASAHRSCGR